MTSARYHLPTGTPGYSPAASGRNRAWRGIGQRLSTVGAGPRSVTGGQLGGAGRVVGAAGAGLGRAGQRIMPTPELEAFGVERPVADIERPGFPRPPDEE